MEYHNIQERQIRQGKENAHLTSAQLAQLAAHLMEDKKAKHVRILDLRQVSTVKE